MWLSNSMINNNNNNNPSDVHYYYIIIAPVYARDNISKMQMNITRTSSTAVLYSTGYKNKNVRG